MAQNFTLSPLKYSLVVLQNFELSIAYEKGQENRETLNLHSANWLLCHCGDCNKKPASFSFHFHQMESIITMHFRGPLGWVGCAVDKLSAPVLTGSLSAGIASIPVELLNVIAKCIVFTINSFYSFFSYPELILWAQKKETLLFPTGLAQQMFRHIQQASTAGGKPESSKPSTLSDSCYPVII